MRTLLCRLLLIALLACCLATQAAITGQWDFQSRDLSATIGQPLTCQDADTLAGLKFGTTTSFGIPDIQGRAASVIWIPRTAEGGGIIVPHGAGPNGGGARVNRYTIILDILFPQASAGKPRALIQTDLRESAEFSVTANDELSTDGGGSNSRFAPNAWHRVAFAVDTASTPATIAAFLDGKKVDERGFITALDGRWSLDSLFVLFNDDNGEVAEGYLNSLQVRDERMPDDLIAGLGGPAAEGILTGPPPNPYIAAVSPAPESAIIPARSGVSPRPQIKIVIENGQTGVDLSSIRLSFDNQKVAPAVVQGDAGRTTTITYSLGAFGAALAAPSRVGFQ